MMNEEVRRKITELIGEMHCPDDFKCAEQGFEELCMVKDIGMDSFLVCLEANPSACKFALAFGHSYYCRCPLRVYISKTLKK